MFLLNGGPISWSSKLQASVAVSTTEAEYVALSTAGCETQYLRALLSELGSPQTAATIIHEDNFGCVQLTKEQVNHSRTKHIDIRFHKIRELVTSAVVSIVQVPTADLLADILTKVLPRPKFQELRAQLMPPPVKFE